MSASHTPTEEIIDHAYDPFALFETSDFVIISEWQKKFMDVITQCSFVLSPSFDLTKDVKFNAGRARMDKKLSVGNGHAIALVENYINLLDLHSDIKEEYVHVIVGKFFFINLTIFFILLSALS